MVTDDRWEVKVGRNVFTMDLSLLKQWVREGRVDPTDRVRPLDGDWLNAGDCTPLEAHFKIHTLRILRTTDEFPTGEPKTATVGLGPSTTADLESPSPRTTGDLLAEAMEKAGTTHDTTGDLFKDGAGTRTTGEFATPAETISFSSLTRPITRELATPVEPADEPSAAPTPEAPKTPARAKARRRPTTVFDRARQDEPENWFENPLTPIIALFLFFPAGLIFMWNNRFFQPRDKWTMTGVTFVTIGALALGHYLNRPVDLAAESLKEPPRVYARPKLGDPLPEETTTPPTRR